MQKLSIHLVTYNGEKYIPFCLQSLDEQTVKDFLLLIIDNNSQDNTVPAIEDFLRNPKRKVLKENTRLIKNSRNLGFAGGHNQALQWTKSDYVLMLNQDIILDRDFLWHILNFADNCEKGAAFTGALFQWDFHTLTENPFAFNALHDGNDALPKDTSHSLTRPDKTDKIDSLGLRIYPNHRVIDETEGELSKPRPIFGVSGALPLYRRSLLDAVKIPCEGSGLRYEFFDNDFHSYKEDVDLAYRLRLFGFDAYLVPQAKAWHDRSAAGTEATVKNRRQKSDYINYHSYKNHLYFLIKNVPSHLFMRYGFLILWYECKKLLYILLCERKTLGAFAQCITHLRRMGQKRAYIQKKAGKLAWRHLVNWLVQKT